MNKLKKLLDLLYRLFKIPNLDNTDGENYGLKICYKGTISACPEAFALDNSHKFIKGKEYSVCGNTFRILKESRFNKHFDFYGNFDTHYGIMPNCGIKLPFVSNEEKCCSVMDLGIIMIIIPMVNNHMDTKEFVLNIILCYSFYNLSFIYNSHFLFINFNIIIIN